MDQQQSHHDEELELERYTLELGRQKMDRQQEQHRENLAFNGKKLGVILEVARIRAGGMSTVPTIQQMLRNFTSVSKTKENYLGLKTNTVAPCYEVKQG